YADGFAYSKGKMEDAFREGGVLDKAPVKPHKNPAIASLKKEDIDLVMTEFEITRPKAEKVLVENGGDVKKALSFLVYGA
ncbi:hypothetical protein DFP72DRAFT_873320, partial [Ephemerocybe angulata]